MELLDSGTVAAAGTATFRDGSWRSMCWYVTNHTAVAGTVNFKDNSGNTSHTITIPAANSSYIPVYVDAQKISVTGVQIDYLVFG